MPKHAFKFPREVVESVKRHVRRAIEGVEPNRYRQEANYTAALVNRLEGTAYQGEHGSVVFHSTVFDDRGPNSAESRLGADHAITATISDGRSTVQKIILVQAKLGHLTDMDTSESDFLKEQLRKMKHLVEAPKVMEIPEFSGGRYPQIVSGNNFLDDQLYTPMDLPDYFVARVTTTLDGCTDPEVISTVQDSSLTRLHVDARLKQKT
jgi:hypothetical protein